MTTSFLLIVALAADPVPADKPVAAEAIAHWQSGLKRSRADSRLWRAKPALDDFAKAIAVDREFAAPYFDRGRMHMHSHKPDEAKADFTQAARLLPQFSDARVALGDALLAKDDYAKARGEFDVAIAILEKSGVKPVVARGQTYTPKYGLDYAFSRRCLVRLCLKDREGAQADLVAAVKHVPKDLPEKAEHPSVETRGSRAARYHLGAAWVLATHPDQAVRDGDRAQRLFDQAEKLHNTQRGIGDDSDAVHAAICAERGQFARAEQLELRYRELVSSMAWADPYGNSTVRLDHYRKREPYRDGGTWFPWEHYAY